MTTKEEIYLKIGKSVCDFLDSVFEYNETVISQPPIITDPELPEEDSNTAVDQPSEPEIPQEPVPEPAPKYRVLSVDPKNYKLTTYKADSKGRPIEIFQPELASYSDGDMYKVEGNIIKVGCPYFGPKTSGDTNSTRHEYRGLGELEFDFNENVEFTNVFSLDEIDQIGRKVVMGQYHDKAQPIFKRVNRYVGDGFYESYYLVKVADNDENDAPPILMGRYRLGEIVKAKVLYNGKDQMMYFENNDNGIIKSLKIARTGLNGKIYPKYLLYPQYIKGDEINSIGKVCRATYYI